MRNSAASMVSVRQGPRRAIVRRLQAAGTFDLLPLKSHIEGTNPMNWKSRIHPGEENSARARHDLRAARQSPAPSWRRAHRRARHGGMSQRQGSSLASRGGRGRPIAAPRAQRLAAAQAARKRRTCKLAEKRILDFKGMSRSWKLARAQATEASRVLTNGRKASVNSEAA